MSVRALSNGVLRKMCVEVLGARAFKKRQGTAYHEAGHAVAAWRLGMKFESVSIDPDREDGTLGSLRLLRPKPFTPRTKPSRSARRDVEDHIAVCFAGQHAEAKFLKSKARGQQRDNETAVNLAICVWKPKKIAEAQLKYCFCAAREMVIVFWPEVEAVAWALLELTSLNYDQVHEVALSARAGKMKPARKNEATC